MSLSISLVPCFAMTVALVACAASGPPASTPPAPAPPPTAPGSSTAESIRSAWNFQDPKASEVRFHELAQAALERGQFATALELETQVARAQGLDRRFDEANATLAAVQAQLDGQPAVVRLRWLLEQGRVLNSSGQPQAARPWFEQAWQLGQAEQFDGLAVDAAHMLAITFVSEPESAIAWNERALALARASRQADAQRWLGSLLNNQGWSYFDRGDFVRALGLFEEALRLRRNQHDAQATHIAQWCVGKALRALGKTQQALEIQLALLAEAQPERADGFVLEELGELQLVLGDAARAREYFARAHAELSQDESFRQNEAARLERIARLGGISAPGR